MGACAILPRLIGHGRAAELLFTGRNMSSDEGLAWGFYNRVVEDVLAEALASPPARARAEHCPRGDQEAARRRMALVDRGCARSGGARRRRIAWRPAISTAPMKRSPTSGRRNSRGLMADRLPSLALLRGAAPRAGRRARRLVRGQSGRPLLRTTSTANAAALVRELGAAGFLKLSVADAKRRPDVRSLAIARETLAYHTALADFAFAMQGLGSGAISLFGTVEQKREWLPQASPAARRLRPSP